MTQVPLGTSRAAQLNKALAPFSGPDLSRSVTQLVLTAAGFAAFWYGMLRSLEVHYALTLLLALPAAGFLVRLFMIQHDCGHGSFFKSRRASTIVGHAIGALTLLPYEYWRRTHAHHHAHSGDLEHRGFGDVETLTVSEYSELPPRGRLAYRIYRNPLVLFGVGALWHFVLKQRLPLNVPRSWKREWRSIWLTNAMIAAGVFALVATIGWSRFLMVHAPIVALTCGVGVWLFYVQHQFEHTYWEKHPDWDFFDAALKGSSHLVLPRPLAWITAHIGLHHLHHLSPRIPNYQLQACLDAHPELEAENRITIRSSLRVTRLHLWDADAGRLISFREFRARMAA
ncbi:MAG: fatty acid desaturase [Gemmatimonadetes bacterium]|nr:fatty acid desaturase [Gemmatimonadota bacterium]